MKKVRIALLLLACISIYSCKKSESEQALNQNGPTSVLINLIEDEDTDEGLVGAGIGNSGRQGSVKSRKDTVQTVQTRIIPFSKEVSILATLSPETTPAIVSAKGSQERLANGRPSTVAATPVRQPLNPNVQYRILVYDSLGVFVATKLYTYGSEATAGGFILDAGKRYTFVGYSSNSTTTVPTVTAQASLATATINTISTDLMYFRKEFRPTFGENKLNAVLKHQFSQITTNLIVAPTTQGNITAVNSTVLRPTRASASIKLSDGVLTYAAVDAAGAPVTFNSFGAGARNISSTPTRLITPLTAAGQFAIGSITLNGTTKGDLALSNLAITPGVRYNLNLTFQNPCTENVNTDGSFTFSVGAGSTAPTKTISAPAADFGFVFDVTQLDNSFNMTINGTTLIRHPTASNRELQFESGFTNQPSNIRFADGTVWGAGTIPAVYEMTGTAANPLLRIVISATGNVTMFGSKVAGGPLFPLQTFNGYVFNTVVWNRTAANSVTVSQVVQNATILTATGYGKRVIPCP